MVGPNLLAGAWTPLVNRTPNISPNGNPTLMLLLSDGTVMVENDPYGSGGTNWFRLMPDSQGSYVDGTWSMLAPMEDSRAGCSSCVQTNGRVFFAGGEYGTGGATAEVYDPVANRWQRAPVPASLLDPTQLSPLWGGNTYQSFGDSICELLPNDNVMISPVAAKYFGQNLIFNAVSNVFMVGPTNIGQQDEASWVKLPDGSILSVDNASTNSERYIPSLNQWVSDSPVPVALYDTTLGELGAAFMLPNGKAFFLGGSSHTAIYTPSGTTNAGSWVAGPDFPMMGTNVMGCPDAPAAMMVNGRVLVSTGPTGTFNNPNAFCEYDYQSNTITPITAPNGSAYLNGAPYYTKMLDLPDGTVLWNNGGPQLYVYKPDGAPVASGKPVISTITRNTDGTYHVVGYGLNGISEGAGYGDDAQMGSNFPLIRMTNSAGTVYYARTYNWSSTGVQTSNTVVTTEFALPAGLPAGTYSVAAAANGIASDPVSMTVPAVASTNLAIYAVASTSYMPSWQTLGNINNNYDPLNSQDVTYPAYGNWGSGQTVNWVEYDWGLPVTTAKIDVYWWVLNDYLPPASYQVQYWNGSSFVPVANASGLGVATNQYNTTTFTPVTTTRLRLVVTGQTLSPTTATGILQWKVYDAGGSPSYWPGAPASSQFNILTPVGGALVGLKNQADSLITQYLLGRLGDMIINYRRQGVTPWTPVRTSDLAASGTVTAGWSADSLHYTALYNVSDGSGAVCSLRLDLNFANNAVMGMSLSVTNLTGQTLELGDFGVPLAMNDQFTSSSTVSTCTMKHSYIEGNSSYVFWMRPDNVPPYLLMTPDNNTGLEYWDVSSNNVYEVYMNSAAAIAAATNAYAAWPSNDQAQANAMQGQRWRQPNTSLLLVAGGGKTYGLNFQWVNSYDDIRQALVNNGKIDVHVLPGMTVPTNLVAQIALNTTQAINSVVAEFPTQTAVQFLNSTNVGGKTYQIYQVQFSKLGENKLTVNYGSSQVTYLEFFVTEPIETLIKKRAAFQVSKQVQNPSKWYNGLFCDWNMADQQMITPDNQDTMSGIDYAIASDDPANPRMAFLATKEVLFPVQSEVTALDYCISNFVWGGIQQTTNDPYPYAIFGTPDWHYWRSQTNYTAIGRGYDYPNFVVLYYEMYRLAKEHPEIHTAMTALQYLQRADNTAQAWWQYGSYNRTGLMNEMILSQMLDDMVAEGLTKDAALLRADWESKVAFFCSGQGNLFASEFAFDATGFESQEAYAKYAVQHAGSSAAMGAGNLPTFNQQVAQYITNQITANVFDRGWLETAYYYYGSDYRGAMGNNCTMTYMTTMGGWGVLDYGLNYAQTYSPNPADYLRLGYGSYLCGWGEINSGTPASNYGFFFPGAANDGAMGSDFEAAADHVTWYGSQPNFRGPWCYAGEFSLGLCGALRTACTVLTDDPIFGRFCYGGTFQTTTTNLQIMPLDGVRRRFHAVLNNGSLHVVMDTDRFVTNQPITLSPDLSQASFQLETGNTNSHTARVHLSGTAAGIYSVNNAAGYVGTLTTQPNVEATCDLPIPAGGGATAFWITLTNTAPTISGIANQVINTNTSTAALPFTVSDRETAAGSLTVSGSSDNQALVPNANIVFGGSGSNRTVTVTPALNQIGRANLTLTVRDGVLTSITSFPLWVTNSAVYKGAISVNYCQSSDVFPATALAGAVPQTNWNQVVWNGSGTSLMTPTNTFAESTGAPLVDFGVRLSQGGFSSWNSGTANASDANKTLCADWALDDGGTVTFANIPYTKYNLYLYFNGYKAPRVNTVNYTIGGNTQILVDSTSSPINFGGTYVQGRDYVVFIGLTNQNPVMTAAGVGGLFSGLAAFQIVYVTNTPPTITGIVNPTTVMNTATPALAFTIGDMESAPTALMVTGSSSNPTLAPNANIVFNGAGAGRTVTVTPTTNQIGTTTITLTVSDGSLTATTQFTVTVVNATNIITATAGTGGIILPGGTVSAPVFSNQSFTITPALGYAISNVVVDGVSQGTATTYAFSSVTASHTISAAFSQLPTNSLNIISVNYCQTGDVLPTAATSGAMATNNWNSIIWSSPSGYSNPTNVYYDAGGTTVSGLGIKLSKNTLTSWNSGNSGQPNQTLCADWALSGGGTATFTNIPYAKYDLYLYFNGFKSPGTNKVNYTISGNPQTLVDSTNAPINFKGTYVQGTDYVKFSGLTNRNPVLTVAGVSGGNYGLAAFQIVSTNTAPTISGIANQSVAINGTTAALPFTITDQETGASNLTVTGGSSNPSLVPNANIVFGGSDSNRTVTVTPAANQSGTATIILSVSDGSLGSSTQFSVVVSSTPTITATAGIGGSVSPSGLVGVVFGSNQPFTISPSPGYAISNLLADGVSQGAIIAYTFTNVTVNHTIAALFTNYANTITATAGTGGSVTPAGTVLVTNGSNQSFAILHSLGYAVSNVVVDGVSQGALNNYTFTNVQTSHIISVMFSDLPLTILNAISVNYCQSGDGLPGTALAGAVKTNNWNSVLPANYASPTNVFYNSSGTTVSGFGVKLSNNNYNSWNSGTPSQPDQTLCADWALNGGGTATFTNIPYATYDLYLYFNGFNGANTENFTFNGNTETLVDSTNSPINFNGAYVQGTDYVKFSSVTNANPLLTVAGVSGGFYGLAAFQIIGLAYPNSAPMFGLSVNFRINPGVALLVTNTATDVDVPAQTLTYAVATTLPAGATLNAANGVLSWRPVVAQANTTNTITVKVTDSGTPNLSATNRFVVIVNPMTAPTLSGGSRTITISNAYFGFTLDGEAGPDYCIQTSTNLVNWKSIVTNYSPAVPFTWQDLNPATNQSLFYRVLIGP